MNTQILAPASDTGAGPGPITSRRYDLDWLRVIAFGLLIFYHTGMFYVTWGFHVKSVYANPAPEPYMQLLSPWRLALLFFISGVALKFAADKARKNGGRLIGFLGRRSWRLLLPIIFGSLIIVAPQTYFELRQDGNIEPGYFSFWAEYARPSMMSGIITPTYNHLWYVVYILVYTPIALMFLRGQGKPEPALSRALGRTVFASPLTLLTLPILPFVVYELTLAPHFPTTHLVVWDWANHAHRLTIFLMGVWVAKRPDFWDAVARAKWIALGGVIGLAYLRWWMIYSGQYWGGFDEGTLGAFVQQVGFVLVSTGFAWSVIVALLGLAQLLLNRPSKLLRYLSGAVFCYYIVHQTITIIVGYYLTQLQIGVWAEFWLVTIATFGGSALAYELLRRAGPLRILMGIKAPPPAS